MNPPSRGELEFLIWKKNDCTVVAFVSQFLMLNNHCTISLFSSSLFFLFCFLLLSHLSNKQHK